MFRFRFKFLADSYLLLFSFFLGMIGAALVFSGGVILYFLLIYFTVME